MIIVYRNTKLINPFEGVQKVFGTLDLFVSLLETEIKYPILQGGILPFWTPSSHQASPLSEQEHIRILSQTNYTKQLLSIHFVT